MCRSLHDFIVIIIIVIMASSSSSCCVENSSILFCCCSLRNWSVWHAEWFPCHVKHHLVESLHIYTKIEHHRCCQWSHLHSINRTLTFSNENDDELVLFIRASSHFFGLCATAMRRHSLGAQRWNTHIWFVRNWTCSNARETFCFDIDFLILTPNLIFVCRMEIWFTWKEMGKNIRLFCCSKRWGNSVFFFFLCLGINRHVL